MFLKKGLTLHKDSRALYKELLDLEICSNKKRLQEDISKDTLFAVKLQTYIDSIFELSDVNFDIEILGVLEKHGTCTSTQQEYVIKHLLDKYANSELVWHALAQRECRGK